MLQQAAFRLAYSFSSPFAHFYYFDMSKENSPEFL
jgi:hypothetical protein